LINTITTVLEYKLLPDPFRWGWQSKAATTKGKGKKKAMIGARGENKQGVRSE